MFAWQTYKTLFLHTTMQFIWTILHQISINSPLNPHQTPVFHIFLYNPSNTIYFVYYYICNFTSIILSPKHATLQYLDHYFTTFKHQSEDNSFHYYLYYCKSSHKISQHQVFQFSSNYNLFSYNINFTIQLHHNSSSLTNQLSPPEPPQDSSSQQIFKITLTSEVW